MTAIAAASTRSIAGPRRTRCSRPSTPPAASCAPCAGFRTNTPLQALATLNDEGFFEFARALAVRLRTEAAPATVDGRLSYGFRLVTSRLPTATELTRLRAYYAETRQRYAATPAAAAEALARPTGTTVTADDIDLAAWTMVGNVLLNLDETVTKG